MIVIVARIYNYFLLLNGCCLVAKSYPILLWPQRRSPPDSSVCGILQARTLKWVAISSSRGSSWPTDWAPVSCVFCTGRLILYHWAIREAPRMGQSSTPKKGMHCSSDLNRSTGHYAAFLVIRGPDNNLFFISEGIYWPASFYCIPRNSWDGRLLNICEMYFLPSVTQISRVVATFCSLDPISIIALI